jgi:hypothetical protein
MDLETRELVVDDKSSIMEPVCISLFIGGEDEHKIITFKI